MQMKQKNWHQRRGNDTFEMNQIVGIFQN